jgi:hypothetical protein
MHDAYEFVLSTLTSLPDSNHEAFLNRAPLATGLLQSVKLTWPSLCMQQAMQRMTTDASSLVYRAYATELALKLFMTAEKFKAISRLAPFTLRWPVYTTIQGIKVLLCAEKFGAGHQAISLQLAANQRWSGPQMTGPQALLHISTASWMAERPHSLKCLTDAYESDSSLNFCKQHAEPNVTF